MRLGIDASTYFEELAHGAKYFDGDREVEPLELFRQNGVDLMRIRVWVNPYSEDGEPYLAGTCDTQNFLKLAKLSLEKGYKIMLDFHYSDFWCDPGKQFVPKAWRGMNKEQLANAVYQHTVDVLRQARQNDIDIEYIQVGNEITNGILWPHGKLIFRNGKRCNYASLAKFLSAGSRGCREVYPNAKIMLHLERSYDQVTYNEFFGNMQKFGVDYDAIGLSYYPYWHGTFEQLFANVENCKKFGKELMIVETGYAFTQEDYITNEHGAAHLVINVAESEHLPGTFAGDYPLSPEGQRKFVQTILNGAQEHGVSAVCWWEPLWIPGDGICWASKAGQKYQHDTSKSTRNEWANQCLFDYQGKKLPACDEFSVVKK